MRIHSYQKVNFHTMSIEKLAWNVIHSLMDIGKKIPFLLLVIADSFPEYPQVRSYWTQLLAKPTSQIAHMERSTKIRERLIECSANGELTFTDELHILHHLLDKFKPISLSDYARKENITVNGAKSRISAGKVINLEMIGKTFIIN